MSVRDEAQSARSAETETYQHDTFIECPHRPKQVRFDTFFGVNFGFFGISMKIHEITSGIPCKMSSVWELKKGMPFFSEYLENPDSVIKRG